MSEAALLLDHPRSANALGVQASKSGRHQDGWKIYKDSASSLIAAAPDNLINKRLQTVLSVAEQERDVQKRASMMQKAFEKLLCKDPSTASGLSRPPTGHRELTGGMRGMANAAAHSLRPRSIAGSRPGTGQPAHPSIANGLSRADGPLRGLGRLDRPGAVDVLDLSGPDEVKLGRVESHLDRLDRPGAVDTLDLSRPDGVELGRVRSPSYTDPRKGPAYLRKYLLEVSEFPPDGVRAPIYRAATAPYFEPTPHATEQYFSAAEKDGKVTSHYTKLGAPKSNSHYKNTLAGAKAGFDDDNPWKTSNQVFQANASKYDVAPPSRHGRDANFQYVNGDPRQGVAHLGQRVMLSAYHRTQAEVNGLGMGGR